MTAIKVSGLTKSFRTNKKQPGFSGAGKTTTLKMLAGLLYSRSANRRRDPANLCAIRHPLDAHNRIFAGEDRVITLINSTQC